MRMCTAFSDLVENCAFSSPEIVGKNWEKKKKDGPKIKTGKL